MKNQMFVGALVLDLSNKTDKQKVADLLNMIMTPFDHTGVADIMERPVFEARQAVANDIVSGRVMMGSTQAPDHRDIPSKTARASSWLRGQVTTLGEVENIYSGGKQCEVTERSSQEAATKLLLRINSDRHRPCDLKNYTERVNQRVTSMMGGQWCATIMYLGPKPIITLAQKNQIMHFSVVTIDNCMMLVWSSEMDAVTQVLNAVGDDHPMAYLKKSTWVNNIVVLNETNTVVIHPMYLLSKVRKWGMAHNFNNLRVLTTLESYLQRNSV